jgi:cytochrome c oxidase subunit II
VFAGTVWGTSSALVRRARPRRFCILTLGLIAILTVTVCGAADADSASPAGRPAAGAKWYPVCASCHGERGEGLDAFSAPALAGLSNDYLVRQLNGFRSGVRGAQPSDTYGQQMASMAAFLADEDSVRDVAAFIQTLPPVSAAAQTGRLGAGKAAAGYKTCAVCHGAAGEGSAVAGAPRIAGQSRSYVLRQLENFKTGRRGSGDAYGRQMAASVAALSDRSLADIADYVAALRQH